MQFNPPQQQQQHNIKSWTFASLSLCYSSEWPWPTFSTATKLLEAVASNNIALSFTGTFHTAMTSGRYVF